MHRPLHYTALGRPQRPTVVFVHGFMGRGADWEGVADALCADYCCLLVDLPGHGRSLGMPDDAYTLDGTAALLREVASTHGGRPCALVGYSMGGRVALYTALQDPAPWNGLVLVSATPGLRTEAERAERRRVDAERAARMRADFDAFLDDWYRMPLFASLHARDGLVASLTAGRREGDPAELARALDGLGTGRQPDLWERLPGLDVSTLALAGALDAAYADRVRAMADAAPRLRADVVPDAGHVLHAERPDALVDRLRAFLSDLSFD